MSIYKLKPKFQKSLEPIKKQLIKRKVHPTTINIIGLCISILGGFVLYYAEKFNYLLIAIPLLVLIRTGLNALDGLVARELNVPNQAFGEVLNELLDRFSDTVLFLGIGFANYTNDILGAIVVILILLNSYLSIVSKAAGGTRQYYGIMGKADRMFYLGIFAIILYIFKDFSSANYFLIFISLGVAITLIQRFKKIKNELS